MKNREIINKLFEIEQLFRVTVEGKKRPTKSAMQKILCKLQDLRVEIVCDEVK